VAGSMRCQAISRYFAKPIDARLTSYHGSGFRPWLHTGSRWRQIWFGPAPRSWTIHSWCWQLRSSMTLALTVEVCGTPCAELLDRERPS
jgi:hypothetical protein